MGFIERIKKISKKIKEKIFNSRTGLISLIIVMIYLQRKAYNKMERIKLSYFLLLLSTKKVVEVLVKKNEEIEFLTTYGDQWYKTDTSMLTKDRLFKILKAQPELVFDSNITDNPYQISNSSFR